MPTEVAERPTGIPEKRLLSDTNAFIYSARLLPGELNDKREVSINIRSLKDSILFINKLEKFGNLKVRIWTKYPRHQYKNGQSGEKTMDLLLSPNASVSLITDSYKRLLRFRLKKNFWKKYAFPIFSLLFRILNN